MTRTQYSDPFSLFRGEMDQLLDNFLSGSSRFLSARQGSAPAINAWESEDAAFVEAEVPGLAMEDLDLAVQGNELTLRGEYKAKTTDESLYHRRERPLGKFSRVVRLPFEVNTANVEATLRNGVLTVKLPKAESARPRKIQIVQ